MRAALNPVGVCLIFGSLLAAGGCTSHGPGSDGEPPKVAGMVSLLHSLHDRRAGAGERYWYEVTIAPTLSEGSHISYASDEGYGHRLQWSDDTIATADVATVVEEVTKAQRMTSVKVDVYHWHRGRWISGWELTRERYPDAAAALDRLLKAKLTTEPSEAAARTQEEGRRKP